MARQSINTGTFANDGTGDDWRTAMQKTEANFVELYSQVAAANGNAGLIANAMARATAGAPIKILCVGTSLTYGLDTTASGGQPAINGVDASFKRSTTPFPEQMRIALTAAGINATVINLGYPGDSTIEGLQHSGDWPASDLTFIEYGHNDANNYNNYAHGPVPIPNFVINYAAMIQQRIAAGSGVICQIPPPVAQNSERNTNISAYRMAVRQTAEQYRCPILDVGEAVLSVTNIWNDTVHLSPAAYLEWGYSAAAMIVSRTAHGSPKVCAGDIVGAADGLMVGFFSIVADTRSKNGYFAGIGANNSAFLAIAVDDDVYPVLTFYNDVKDQNVSLIYSGGAAVSPVEFQAQVAFGARQTVTGPQMRRGFRILQIRNNSSSDPVYLEQIEFSRDAPVNSRGRTSVARGMTTFQPRRISDAQGSFWTHVDRGTRVKAPMSIIASVRLTAGNLNGIALYQSPSVVFSDFVAISGMLAMRQGTSLVLNNITNASFGSSPTTIANVFTAGQAFEGEMEMEITTAGVMNVYIDGALKGTRNGVPYTTGWPGLFAAKAESMRCYMALVSDVVKGPN